MMGTKYTIYEPIIIAEYREVSALLKSGETCSNS